jgi:hypothetical protein
MKTTKLTGYALAAAAAGLFATVTTTGVLAADKAAAATVKCENSSACKGKGECKTAKNDCKGHNACKGQGMTSQKDDASCKKAQGDAAKKS